MSAHNRLATRASFLAVCFLSACGSTGEDSVASDSPSGLTTPETSTASATNPSGTPSSAASPSAPTVASSPSTTQSPSASQNSTGKPALSTAPTDSDPAPSQAETTPAPSAQGEGGKSSSDDGGTPNGEGGLPSTATPDAGVPNGATGGATTIEIEPLDCGADGWAVENHGPPENRVNYVILADGYDETSIDTTLEEHIHTAFERRFEHETGEPYGRYRKFVNVCVMKVVSESNGIGNGPTAFSGGNGGDRLARVDERAVYDYLDENLPERIEPSWTAVVLNQDLWENTGALIMLWSGANNDAAGAALHEGGHGFHQLADEYGSCTGAGCGEDTNGSGPSGREYEEVNTTGDPMTTDGKWDLWLGSTQVAIKDPLNGKATGVQSTFSGSRYESPESGQYRPSDNSMMNSLFGLDPDTSYNSVSREQMVFGIWQFVHPIDTALPEPGNVSAPQLLQVNVIDPEVINVDWSVDDEVVAENGGTTFDTSSLDSGTHTVSARAYDNATLDLVRQRSGECPSSVTGYYCHGTAWPNNEETVEWTVEVP